MGGIKVSYESSGGGKVSSAGTGPAAIAAAVAAADAALDAAALDAEAPQGMEKVAAEQAARDLVHGRTPGGGGVVVNCLACGYVNVISAKTARRPPGPTASGHSHTWGACSSCGASLDRDPSVTGVAGFARALELKDRLVRYDAESIARTAVYDDESDYYTSAAWLSELEQEELKKRDAARHERLHTRRRDVTVTIDLAGRRVVEEHTDQDTVEAARARFLREEAARKESLEDLKERLGVADQRSGSSCGAVGGGDGGGGGGGAGGGGGGGGGAAAAAGSDVNNDDDAANGGKFSNDTLTGRSAEIMATIDYSKMKKKSNNKGGGKGGRGGGGGGASGVTADLTRELAPWRSSEGGGGSTGQQQNQQQKKRRNVQTGDDDDVSLL